MHPPVGSTIPDEAAHDQHAYDSSAGSDPVETGTPAAIITLRVIETLATSPQGLGVTQIAQKLGMPKARVHRHLTVLREHGYVMQDARTNRYRAGWQLFLLGQACVSQFDVATLARPIMERLRDTVGQTIVIATYDDGNMVVIDVARGIAAVEITLRPGTRFILNAVAQGKVMLAYGPPELLRQMLSKPLQQSTTRTINNPDRLLSEIDLVKRRGWADAPEELFTGINAIAAPIFRADGGLFGTLAIVGSIHYLPQTPDTAHVEALRHAAREISQTMGYAGS